MKKMTKTVKAILISCLAVLLAAGATIGALFGFGVLGKKDNNKGGNPQKQQQQTLDDEYLARQSSFSSEINKLTASSAVISAIDNSDYSPVLNDGNLSSFSDSYFVVKSGSFETLYSYAASGNSRTRVTSGYVTDEELTSSKVRLYSFGKALLTEVYADGTYVYAIMNLSNDGAISLVERISNEVAFNSFVVKENYFYIITKYLS